MYSIRSGEVEEINGFSLFSEDNEGNEIVVIENEEGEVVGYAQMSGQTIYFLESIEKGAGRALVDHLKAEYGYLVADSVDNVSAGFWERMGFTAVKSGWGSIKNYEWESEE